MHSSHNSLTPPEFDYCASTDILREKSLKVSSAIAAIGLALSSGIYGIHEPTQLPQKPSASDIDIYTIHPMRIVPDQATANDLPPGFSDQEIIQNIDNFGQHIKSDTQGTLTVKISDEFRQGEGLPTMIVRPRGNDNGKSCYPADQLRGLLPTNHELTDETQYDTTISLPARPICTTSHNGNKIRTAQRGASGAAFAYTDNTPLTIYNVITDESGLTTGTFFRYDLPGDADKISGIILHEQGHDLGLSHIGKIECPDLDVSSLDIQDIASTDYGCDFIRNSEGDINRYAGASSVMGHRTSIIPREGRHLLPLYNTADLNQLKPDAFRIETIDISSIAHAKDSKEVYLLEYGKDKLNGIQISLPTDHPLRKAGGFDNDKVVITIDPIHTTATPGEQLDYTNTVFNPHIAARGGNVNIDLPGLSPLQEDRDIIVNGNVTYERGVLYRDEDMGIVVTTVTTKVDDKVTGIALEVTGYGDSIYQAQ